MGAGVGVNPSDVQKLGWVDQALMKLSRTRRITVFTRHYLSAMFLASQQDLIVTVPSKAAWSQRGNSNLIIKPAPFRIEPIELKMAWSPLLQSNLGHLWMRSLIKTVADEIES